MTLDATVFVVDPDPGMRAWLATAIRRTGWVQRALDSASMLLSDPAVATPSCIVLNVGSPDVAGLDVLRRLTAERRESPVIAIADRGDVPMTVRAMKAGAVEFLTKPLTCETLLPAIDYALSESRSLVHRTAELREFRRRFESLTGRERAVMHRVVAGDLNKRIGAALGISEVTVKAHRGKVMRKMGADSLADLVTMALRLGIPPVHVEGAANG